MRAQPPGLFHVISMPRGRVFIIECDDCGFEMAATTSPCGAEGHLIVNDPGCQWCDGWEARESNVR